MLLMRSEFSFPYIGIQYDMPKCKFYFEKQQFKMLHVNNFQSEFRSTFKNVGKEFLNRI